MAGNGLSVADGTADIDFTDGVDTYGFKLALNSSLSETRGSAYAGQISSGGSNYEDAEPWKRKVYDNFLGGFGQVSDNKVTGGTGIGGDDTKYFYGDCKTDRAGYLLPGMARNLIYNTVSGQTVPVSGQADPNAGDEYEVPRGVLPVSLNNLYSLHNTLTVGGSNITGVTNMRVLIQLQNVYYSSSYSITCKVYQANALKVTYTFTITPSAVGTNYNGWCWVTLTGSAFTFLANTTYDLIFNDNSSAGVIATIGCYCNKPGNTTSTPTTNVNALRPYFQLCKPGTTTPYKWWSAPLRKAHQLLNGTTYVNVAVTQLSLFNMGATSTPGTALTSPERTLSGGYTGSIVFNNKLYVSTSATSGTAAWSAADAAANNPPTNALDSGVEMYSPVAFGGNLYFVDGATRTAVLKWNGNFPVGASNPVQTVVAANTIGQAGSPITRLFLFQGNLFVAKAEGIFQLYADPAVMDTNPGNTPRIIPIEGVFPFYHQANGLFVHMHQGTIFVNSKDKVMQLTPGTNGSWTVTPITLPMPWYRLGYYHQVDGITSDGVNLYVSYNNLGVFTYVNQVWHPVAEVYETINFEPTISGLTWIPSPTGGCDSLYFRDYWALVQIPIPNAATPYTRQITLADQNKCGYLITSMANMDQAEIVKYVQSVVLAAIPATFCYLIRPVVWTGDTVADYGTAPSFTNLLTTSWSSGLLRDSWMNPTVINYPALDPSSYEQLVASQQIGAAGGLVANTIAPTYWTPADFQNNFYAGEKYGYRIDNTQTTPEIEMLTNPAKFVQTAFIIYFWNPVPGQHATTGADLMAVDSFVVKYQAVQDYLASYQCVIDFHLTVSGTGSNTNTTQQIEDAYEWLRSQTGRHSPLKVTFRKRVTGASSGKIKTVYFLPQNPGWISDPTLTALAGGDPGEPLVKTVSLQMVATTSEYANV